MKFIINKKCLKKVYSLQSIIKKNLKITNKLPLFLQIALLQAFCCILFSSTTLAQSCKINNFTSVNPTRGKVLKLPPSHTFQKIIKYGERFSNNDLFLFKVDFTGYVPINNSNTNGYLSINNESTPGGVAVLDITYDENSKLWSYSNAVNLDFRGVGGTARNCSGAVTPWGTVISSEEVWESGGSNNAYKPYGWQVEINPSTKTVIGKHYAMGNFAHENAAILQQNGKTVVYQGADQTEGYLFKFVSYEQDKLAAGDLYVYRGPKAAGTGEWVKIENTTIEDRNKSIDYAIQKNATVFDKIEDVEIGPNGLVYFAVKEEAQVYFLEDTNPLGVGQVNFRGTYVGGNGKKYLIETDNGTFNESWGTGNDNLAFDNDGNLWVLQDGSQDHIWLVRDGHTQTNPKVEIFATTPFGSEPTGITFSPDNRFMFISMQFSGRISSNETLQDANGTSVKFDDNIALVVARKEHLGNYNTQLGCTDSDACNYNISAIIEDCSCTYDRDCENTLCGMIMTGDPCNDFNSNTTDDKYDENCNCVGRKLGCTNMNACNYDAEAEVDNSACEFFDCNGICGGSNNEGTQCNDFNSNTTDDKYDENCNCVGKKLGCTNMNACNYDPEAEVDNSFCLIPGQRCFDNNPNTNNDVIITVIDEITGERSCDCKGEENCLTDLNDTGTINDGIYSVSNSIQSTGTIDQSQNVEYNAGASICLDKGFLASSTNGAVFLSIIGGCTPQLREGNFVEKVSTIKNFPNPFTGETIIEYEINNTDKVSLIVTDVTGKVVANLLNGINTNKGIHQFKFDGNHLSEGIYYCTLLTNEKVETKKMILLK